MKNRNMRWPAWASPFLLAVIMTGLNAWKPPHVDDFQYLTYAREFAAHPTAPYDFNFGSPFAGPAIASVVPPVLPGWLALGMTLWGDDLIVLKCWLFPFAWLLSAAVAALFRRFAPRLWEPLTWLIVLSPGILPSFNFMLEVPVLGLQLTALTLAMKACDRGRWRCLIAAGLVIGLALQTKYTAFAVFAAMVLWCLQARRPLFAATVFLLGLGVFAGWELFIALRHGDSHFLLQFAQRTDRVFLRIIRLVLPLVAILGGIMPAAILLGLAALGKTNRSISSIAGVIGAGFLALALVPDEWATWGKSAEGKAIFTYTQALYGLLGALTCGVVIAVSRQLDYGRGLSLDRFLILWCAAEIAWYFLVSPTAAVRRVLGTSIVLTLLIARLAERTCSSAPRIHWVWGSAVVSGALGLMFFAVDLQHADVERRAGVLAAQGDFQPEEGGTAWFLGHGFAVECQRQGMRALVINETPPRVGDVVFVPVQPYRAMDADGNSNLEKIGTISVFDGWPLRSYLNFYHGSAPLRHGEGPRLVVAVYRVRRALVP